MVRPPQTLKPKVIPKVLSARFKKILVLLGTLLLTLNIDIAWLGNVDEDSIVELRFPKSYNVQTYRDNTIGILNISYNVNLRFPLKEVLRFYDDKFKEIGWVPFVEPYYRYGDRIWQHFIDGTVEG